MTATTTTTMTKGQEPDGISLIPFADIPFLPQEPIYRAAKRYEADIRESRYEFPWVSS